MVGTFTLSITSDKGKDFINLFQFFYIVVNTVFLSGPTSLTELLSVGTRLNNFIIVLLGVLLTNLK